VHWQTKAGAPTAAIVVQADTQQQLTDILLALSNAVERAHNAAKEQTHTYSSHP
jgi:hypothetical protein